MMYKWNSLLSLFIIACKTIIPKKFGLFHFCLFMKMFVPIVRYML